MGEVKYPMSLQRDVKAIAAVVIVIILFCLAWAFQATDADHQQVTPRSDHHHHHQGGEDRDEHDHGGKLREGAEQLVVADGGRDAHHPDHHHHHHQHNNKHDQRERKEDIVAVQWKETPTHPREQRPLYKNDLRSHVVLKGNAISNADTLFPDLSPLCGAGPGLVGCVSRKSLNYTSSTSSSSSSSSSSTPQGCCCSWTPSVRSCSGPFNGTNGALMKRVVLAHYVHTPTSRAIPSLQSAARGACPWFDRGMWNLPDDFLDLNLDDAAAASARASAHGADVSQQDIELEKSHRRNTGPLLVWKLGREMRRLRPHRVHHHHRHHTTTTRANNNHTNDDNSNESSTMMIDAPGMMIISGDSHIRQTFARLIHSIRSRECSDASEQFRGGVFERYFHLSAGYVVTTKGDALALDWADCERVGAEPLRSSLVHGRVLLRVCYVWDNTNDASLANFGTEFAMQRLAQLTTISAVLYSPTMHHCNYAGGKCQSANMSNGAVMTVIAQALKFDVPRVVVTTTIMRQWYPYYAMGMIRERNEQLRSFFGVNMFDSVAVDEKILAPWRRRRTRRPQRRQASSDNSDDTNHNSNDSGDVIESVEKSLYWAMGTFPSPSPSSSSSSAGMRFRLYDYAVRQVDLTPRQCDHGHSMCMFFPLRVHPKARTPVNGMSGVCPNGSRCEDPWNFLMLHEILSLMLA